MLGPRALGASRVRVSSLQVRLENKTENKEERAICLSNYRTSYGKPILCFDRQESLLRGHNAGRPRSSRCYPSREILQTRETLSYHRTHPNHKHSCCTGHVAHRCEFRPPCYNCQPHEAYGQNTRFIQNLRKRGPDRCAQLILPVYEIGSRMRSRPPCLSHPAISVCGLGAETEERKVPVSARRSSCWCPP